MGIKIRKLTAAVAGSMMAATFAGCGTNNDGNESTSKDPLRVVYVGGVTGPLSTISDGVIDGLEAAIEDVGGVSADGRKIELSVLDSTGDPTQAVSVLQGDINKNGAPDLVIPGVSSPEGLAMVPLLTRNNVLSIGNAVNDGLNDPEKYPFAFSIAPAGEDLYVGLPDYLKQESIDELAVLVPNGASGEPFMNGVTAVLEGTDVSIKIIKFNPESLDLTQDYQRALDAGPDAILMDGIGEVPVRLMNAREATRGWDVPAVLGFTAVATQGGPTSYAPEKTLDNLAMSTYRFQSYVEPADRSDQLTSFVEGIGAEGLKDGVLAPALYWDVIHIWVAAMEQAGSSEAEAVSELLEGDFEVPPLVMWNGLNYTTESHFTAPPKEDFAFIDPDELVDGMFKPTTS